MHRPTLLVALAACFAVAVNDSCSAAPQAFTSPTGFDQLEGDASHFAIFNSSVQRFMQIDATQPQAVSNIRALSFRRDSDRVSATGGARTLDLTVLMGHANFAAITGTFASNYLTPPTTVFTRKPVNVPDWSQLAGTRPAPWDFSAMFDTPWSYNGTDALVYELHMENVSSFGSPEVDRELGSTNTFNQAIGTSSRDGCLVMGQGLEMVHTLTLQNFGPNHPMFGLRVGTSVLRGPIRQPAVVNYSLFDANIMFPGLCAPIHSPPDLGRALGMTNVVGNIDETFFDIPFTQRLDNVRIYSQVAVLDPSRSPIVVSLSDSRNARMPAAPRPSPMSAYLYAPGVASPSATLFTDRGIITRFEQ